MGNINILTVTYTDPSAQCCRESSFLFSLATMITKRLHLNNAVSEYKTLVNCKTFDCRCQHDQLISLPPFKCLFL